MSQIQHPSTAAAFSSLLSSTHFVIADFYADWCGPCHAIAPLFAQLASAHAHPTYLQFAKINVDALQSVAAQYGVTAMPTFMLFKEGKVVKTFKGANPAALRALVVEVEKEVTALKTADKEEKKTAETTNASAGANGEQEKKADDDRTVSGGYSMSSGARSDWKFSLRG